MKIKDVRKEIGGKGRDFSMSGQVRPFLGGDV